MNHSGGLFGLAVSEWIAEAGCRNEGKLPTFILLT